jgi:MFS family permease
MTLARSVKGFGSGLWFGYLPKALETLGANGPMIGSFGMVSSGASAIFYYLGGAISDRLGRGRALIFSAVVSLFGYLIYALSPKWWLFIPGSIFLTASALFSFMGSMALVGETLGTDRRAVGMASLGLLALPITLAAPPLGGFLIQRLGMMKGFRIGVVLTIVLTLVSIWIQRKLYKLPPPAVKTMSLNVRSAWAQISPELRYLLLANCIMTFGSGMSSLFTVLYVMNVMGTSAVFYGLLQSIMTASTAVFSIPAGKLSDRRGMLGRKPYAMMAFLLIAVYPFLLVLAPSPVWLIPIFIIRGVRESFDLVRKAMIVDLAGSKERGRTIGFYFFVLSAAGFPSSLIAGWLWQWHATAPFLTGGIISFLGFFLYLWKVPGHAKETQLK